MSSKKNGLVYASASLIFGTTVMGIILSNAELSLVKSSAPLISILLALCLATGALMFIWWFFRRGLPDILWLVINTPRAIKYLKYDIKLFFASKRQKNVRQKQQEILQQLDAIEFDDSLSDSQKTLKTVELFRAYGLTPNAATYKSPKPTDSESAE